MIVPTLEARLKCFALSRSMSWCERMGSFSSLLTTIPGPSVAGPPENTRMRAPVLGKVDYSRMMRVRTTSGKNTTHLQ